MICHSLTFNCSHFFITGPPGFGQQSWSWRLGTTGQFGSHQQRYLPVRTTAFPHPYNGLPAAIFPASLQPRSPTACWLPSCECWSIPTSKYFSPTRSSRTATLSSTSHSRYQKRPQTSRWSPQYPPPGFTRFLRLPKAWLSGNPAPGRSYARTHTHWHWPGPFHYPWYSSPYITTKSRWRIAGKLIYF